MIDHFASSSYPPNSILHYINVFCADAGACKTLATHSCSELYTIFEYQARLICHLSQKSPKRGLRGILKLDDWEGMLKRVQASADKCTQYCTFSDREREKEFYDNESSRMLQSVDIQKRILDTFEASQARRQQDRRDDKEAELLETLAVESFAAD